MEDRNRQRRVYRWEDRIEKNWRLSKKQVKEIFSELGIEAEIKDTYFRNWKNCSTMIAEDYDSGTKYTLYIQKKHRDLKAVLHEAAHVLLDMEKTSHSHDEVFVLKLIDLLDEYEVDSKENLLESARKCRIIT